MSACSEIKIYKAKKTSLFRVKFKNSLPFAQEKSLFSYLSNAFECTVNTGLIPHFIPSRRVHFTNDIQERTKF